MRLLLLFPFLPEKSYWLSFYAVMIVYCSYLQCCMFCSVNYNWRDTSLPFRVVNCHWSDAITAPGEKLFEFLFCFQAFSSVEERVTKVSEGSPFSLRQASGNFLTTYSIVDEDLEWRAVKIRMREGVIAEFETCIQPHL